MQQKALTFELITCIVLSPLCNMETRDILNSDVTLSSSYGDSLNVRGTAGLRVDQVVPFCCLGSIFADFCFKRNRHHRELTQKQNERKVNQTTHVVTDITY